MLKQKYEETIKKYIPNTLQDYIIDDLIDNDCLCQLEKSYSQGVLKDYFYTLEWRKHILQSK